MTAPTLGVEEEFLLVHAGTGLPRADAEQVLAAARRESDNGLDDELRSAMVETGSAVCPDLPTLAAELRRRRALLARAAHEVGAQVLASATHPTAPPDDVPITADERYQRMATEFGRLVDESLVCGCHVHVAVPDRAAGVGVLDRIRPWLPVLLALSANSPLWRGRDTRYASWRTQVWTAWPTAGPTSAFGSVAAYEALAERLVATGAALDERMLYFDARLSSRYPTVEIRVADVGLEIDDALLVAGLARGLTVRALSDLDCPPPAVPVELLRAASWVASRHGTTGSLVHPLTGERRPADEVVEALLEHLGDALASTGDRDEVERGLDRVRREGTGAERQRAALTAGGDPALRELLALCC